MIGMRSFLSATPNERSRRAVAAPGADLTGGERRASGEATLRRRQAERSAAKPSSDIGSANSAPSLSPAIHLTTALARSRPGKHQPDARADLELAVGHGHEAALGDVDHRRFDAARAELAHRRLELDRLRVARRRSRSASAMRALKVTKLISTARLPQRCRERQADPSVADPAHLGRHNATLEQLQRQALADVRNVRENHHRARRGNVDELDDMLAAAKLEHRGARHRRMARLATLVDRSAARSAGSSSHQERNPTPPRSPT